MARVVLGMTMSVDGFVTDRHGSVGDLYSDFDTLRDTDAFREDIESTGAVVMGRNAYAMSDDPDSYADSYEFQVPIFVLTHEAPERVPKQNDRLIFTFVTDGIESAISQAKRAAGDKDVVVVGGASTAQQCLQAALVDELHVDIMPVLLSGGLRLFEGTGAQIIKLETIKVLQSPTGRTHLRFRVVK